MRPHVQCALTLTVGDTRITVEADLPYPHSRFVPVQNFEERLRGVLNGLQQHAVQAVAHQAKYVDRRPPHQETKL